MRADGEVLRVIAARFGVAKSTLVRWTDEEYAEYERALCRANKLRYRGECVDCGKPTSGDAPGNAAARCMTCNGAHQRARREAIQEMFEAGLSYREMADRIGIGVGTLNSHITKMRAEGWDLPRRKPGRRPVAA